MDKIPNNMEQPNLTGREALVNAMLRTVDNNKAEYRKQILLQPTHRSSNTEGK